MNKRLVTALILGVFVTYTSSSVLLADYIIDDFQGADITMPPNLVTVNTVVSSGDISVNRVGSGAEGYKVAYSGLATGATATASIEYSFTNGLLNLFKPGYPQAPVKFYIPIFLDNITEGQFTVSANKFFSSGSPIVTSITPDATSNSMLEIDTQRTIADLGTNDITSIRFDFTYSVGTYLGGTDQTIILGGGTGVNPYGKVGTFTAVPEPTSVAMIGCAMLGLIARRRKKA